MNTHLFITQIQQLSRFDPFASSIFVHFENIQIFLHEHIAIITLAIPTLIFKTFKLIKKNKPC